MMKVDKKTSPKCFYRFGLFLMTVLSRSTMSCVTGFSMSPSQQRFVTQTTASTATATTTATTTPIVRRRSFFSQRTKLSALHTNNNDNNHQQAQVIRRSRSWLDSSRHRAKNMLLMRHMSLEGLSTTEAETLTNNKESKTAQRSSSAPELPPQTSTSKRLFLVRHGEVINPGGDRPVYYGAMDVPLSPLGELEAQAAAEYLSQYELAFVFSSPLSRAVYGAEQVLKLQKILQGDNSKNSEIVVLDGFKELDRGDWCGKTKDEIGAEAMERFDACDESVTPANGESYPALKRRVLDAFQTALSKLQPGQAACIVSHLQVTRSILSEALEVPTSRMTTLKVATASVTCLDYDEMLGAASPTVHFQSFKPDAGLKNAKDGAN